MSPNPTPPTPRKGDDIAYDSVDMVRNPRDSYVVSPLLLLEVATPEKK